MRYFWNVSGFDRERGTREHGYNSQHPYTKFTKFMYKTNESYWLDHLLLFSWTITIVLSLSHAPLSATPPGL